ncbi:phosphoribose diphosphate:decaprenyl-phosphate phosphoribosyltransferase [Ornatilinea apprima]|uniref:Phosphoribose diphosphate:decaprenyl-phosphate phosphoribosyltransferase n=1 Tax=Ornatilinea apprima TaxID=1134406 RepID=A0A0P6XRI1_9CHLR|nr:decaprenyl-phosphate phosphoribosyltransferase [Ornatilinea apprima]KPL77870.1 phosphoribose diphosphate:decaprenyl-phosphate phosphoribosyltransferase [Ornatilinea apprima]
MLMGLIKSMRPRQWTKNVFVLAALVFDRQLNNPLAVSRTLAGLIIFCFISSAVYLINDVKDIEADRAHPRKKNRPIASGQLPVRVAVISAVIIIMFSLAASIVLSPLFAMVVVLYLIINVLYSFWLKHVPLIDVLLISAGFVLRVSAGVTLIVVERFSPWLFAVTTLFTLYLGFGKRRAELATLSKDQAQSHRRVLDGYTIPLLDQLITIVSSTTIMAYSLYTFSAVNLPENHTMMLTIPFVIYGIFRYLYLIQVKGAGGAPEDMVLSDRPLQITVALYCLAVLLIFYIFS